MSNQSSNSKTCSANVLTKFAYAWPKDLTSWQEKLWKYLMALGENCAISLWPKTSQITGTTNCATVWGQIRESTVGSHFQKLSCSVWMKYDLWSFIFWHKTIHMILRTLQIWPSDLLKHIRNLLWVSREANYLINHH